MERFAAAAHDAALSDFCKGIVIGMVNSVASSVAYRGSTCRGACAVRVLGLFHRPFHPKPIRVNDTASEPTRGER